MFEIWTIYADPNDYPGLFVARKFMLDVPTDEIIISESLTDLREILNTNSAQDLICFERSEVDDPKIVESWL
jgi:hypothetical protein